MKIESFNTEKAPQPTSIYSQSIKYDNLVFLCGQVPVLPNGTRDDRSVMEKAELVMKNIGENLNEAGSCFDKVLKVNVFIEKAEYLKPFDEAYCPYFINSEHPPVRSVIVTNFVKNNEFQVDVIAAAQVLTKT